MQQSMGSQIVGYDFETEHARTQEKRKQNGKGGNKQLQWQAHKTLRPRD